MFEQIPDRPTGAQSIEPHIVLVRRGLVAFVKEHLQDGWELGDQDGLVWITFKREITNADFNAFVRAHYRGTKRRESGLFRTRVKLLASAGNMGAWGFNLPAGPPGYFGTCIGSVPGFPTLDPEQQGLVRSHAAEGVEIQPERTICSGCYALKGRYGSPSQQFQLEVRRQVTVDLLAGPAGVKRFADTFERAIVMAQAWSLRAVAELKRRKMPGLVYTIENPAFFRLHDSGDLYSRKYLQAWVEVASRFAKPRRAEGLRLPAITFWVPTRTWFARGLSGNHASVCPQTEDLKCVPPNMVIRPSSMHFGDKAPDLASIGYSAGTSAAKAAERGLLADWACPATLPPSLGGGAEPDPRRPGRWIQRLLRQVDGSEDDRQASSGRPRVPHLLAAARTKRSVYGALMPDRPTYADVASLARDYVSTKNPGAASPVVARAQLREMLMAMGQRRWNTTDLSDEQWESLLGELGFGADDAGDLLEDIAGYGAADVARADKDTP